MNEIKYLSDKATRQEHLSDLLDWMNVQSNVWAGEYKRHHSPDDKVKLAVYEAAIKLLKGYVDSFTKDIVTDVEEPKIERERLGDIDTRYSHLTTLMEMWRDATEFIREHSVGKITPTADLNKIRMFNKTIEIVEIYQENMTGEFDYPGVSRTYPSFKDGSGRLLRPVCDEAYKAGVASNKKRLLDAANEKIEVEKETEGIPSKGQTPSKNEDERILSDTQETARNDENSEGDAGLSSVT